jgi:hypothetical protein
MGKSGLIGKRIFIEERQQFGRVAKVSEEGQISHAYVFTNDGEQIIAVIGLTIRLVTLAEILIDQIIRLWRKWFAKKNKK